MAEFQIWVGPEYSGDSRPVKGDIVTVMQDGTAWGGLDCLELFLIVRIDMPYNEARELKHRRSRIDVSGVDLDAVRAAEWLVVDLPRSVVVEI